MKDGRKAWFGGKNAFDKDSCLYDPDHYNDITGLFDAGWGVFQWGLSREEDVSNNAVVYQYQKPDDYNNMILSSIIYNFDGTTPLVGITFESTPGSGTDTWASYRESYRAKFQQVSYRFLTSITESVSGRSNLRVRQYKLDYAELDYNLGKSISRLKSVQEYGETDADKFPPVTFEYSGGYDGDSPWDYHGGTPIHDDHPYQLPYPIHPLNSRGVTARFGDYNGDGLPDIVWAYVDTGGTFVRYVALNTGSGWDTSSPSANAFTPPNWSFTELNTGQLEYVFSADITGDGLCDLMESYFYNSWVNSGIARNTGTGWNTSVRGTRYPEGYPLNDGYFSPWMFGYYYPVWELGARSIDLNGDGFVDILWSQDYHDGSKLQHCAINNGAGWDFYQNGSSPFSSPWGVTYWNDDNKIYPRWTGIVDLNGDGLTDLTAAIGCTDGYVKRHLAINNGTGWNYLHREDNTSPILDKYFMPWDMGMSPYPGNYYMALDAGVRFIDFNGDGLTDFLKSQTYGYSGEWSNWAGVNTGNAWIIDGHTRPFPYCSPHMFVDNGNPSSCYTRDQTVQMLDINGDGLTDMVWATDDARGNMIYALALNKSHPPNLLTHIDNGIGGTVDVEYSPSTKGFMKLYDPESGLEVTDKVPFVLQVTSKITKTGQWPDETGSAQAQSYTTLYRYAGGKYLDREFRGFGKVKEIDATTGNFTIKEFHQDFARKGQVKSVRSYVGDRRDYRTDGTINGPLRQPSEEAAPAFAVPKRVSETHIRYRVVIHSEDVNHLKTFTDTHEKLGLSDFPKGMTLVTPACSITRIYEYGDNYATGVPRSVTTAQEIFFDGRGNQTQSVNYGQVTLQVPDAALDQLANPRLDYTFTDSVLDPDGQVAQMTEFSRLGDWMDVPVLVNKAGYYTADRTTGVRAVDDVKVLEAKAILYDPVSLLPIEERNSLDTQQDTVTRYQYDSYGNVTRITNPRGYNNDIAYETDYHTFPRMKTNALGHHEYFVFDPGYGNLLSHTDANNHQRSAQYDGLGRILTLQDSSGNTITSYEYAFADIAGWTTPNRVRTITHTPTGDVWSEERYDGLGRKYERLSVGQNGPEDPICEQTSFNDRGMVWKRTFPYYKISEAENRHWRCQIMENDDPEAPSGVWAQVGLSRPVKSRQELNATQIAENTIIYEAPLSRKTMDPLGHERRVVSDAFGNQVGVWEPNANGSVGDYPNNEGQYTRFGYDAAGRLEFVRRHVFRDQQPNDKDPVTNLWYDTLGRKVMMDDPDRGVSTYAYDLNGNLTRTLDARGVETAREYDALDRLTRLVCPDITSGDVLLETYTYDSGTGANLIGCLARVETSACTTEYSYDDEGRTTLTRRSIDGTSYSTATAYDYAGRSAVLTYPDGMQLLYGYDTTTQALKTITQQGTGQPFLKNETLSKFGTYDNQVLGNDVTETILFDWAGRLDSVATSRDAALLNDLRYTYAPDSNITRIQNLAGPVPQGDMYYGYDVMKRLTKAWGTTMSGVGVGTEGAPGYLYAYDTLGRMTYNRRFQGGHGAPYSLGYEYSQNPGAERPAHGVKSIRFTREGYPPIYAHTFTYDPMGNLVSSTNEAAALPENNLERSYTWDALGRMASVNLGTSTTTFAYDNTGARVKKVGPDGTVTYVGDLVEVTSAGMTKHVFDGPRRLATIKPSGEILFYSSDHLGSSVLITDASGNEVQRLDYEPYGAFIENERSGNAGGIRHTFTGQEADSESGLMYYRARYYDPVVGLFVGPDSIIPNPTNPQAFNCYAYVYNNPVLLSDPTGNISLNPVKWIEKGAEAVGGAAKDVVNAQLNVAEWSYGQLLSPVQNFYQHHRTGLAYSILGGLIGPAIGVPFGQYIAPGLHYLGLAPGEEFVARNADTVNYAALVATSAVCNYYLPGSGTLLQAYGTSVIYGEDRHTAFRHLWQAGIRAAISYGISEAMQSYSSGSEAGTETQGEGGMENWRADASDPTNSISDSGDPFGPSQLAGESIASQSAAGSVTCPTTPVSLDKAQSDAGFSPWSQALKGLMTNSEKSYNEIGGSQ